MENQKSRAVVRKSYDFAYDLMNDLHTDQIEVKFFI
jgi:hypothetical protein